MNTSRIRWMATLLLAMFCVTTVGAGPFPQEEEEHRTICIGETVTGELTPGNRFIDWYLMAEEGWTLSMAFRRTTGALGLHLQLSGESSLVNSSGTDSAGEISWERRIGRDGDYRLRLSSWGSVAEPVTYELTLTGTDANGAEILDTACLLEKGFLVASHPAGPRPLLALGTQPEVLASNSSPGVEGVVDAERSVIPYLFAGNQGDQLSITMTRASGDLIPLVGLADSRGTLLTQASADLSGRQANLKYKLLERGWYVVYASREGAEDGTTTGTFSLSLSGVTLEYVPPMELPPPTDLPVSTTTIQANDSVDGSLDNSEHILYYLFAGREGDAVTVEMTRTAGDLEPLVGLLAKDLAVLARGSLSANGRASIATATLPATDWYVVAATRSGMEEGNTIGDFSLRIAGVSPVLVTVEGVGPQPEVPDALVLWAGQTVGATIDNDHFLHRYLFAGNSGDEVTITMTRQSGDLVPLLGLSDANDGLLDRKGSDLAGRVSELRYTLPETGWYIIDATREDVDLGSSAGEFSLKLDVVPNLQSGVAPAEATLSVPSDENQAAGEQTPVPHVIYGIVASGASLLNVRAQPNGNVVYTIKDGVSVSVLGRDISGVWVHVSHTTENQVVEGWVMAQFLHITRGGVPYDVMLLPVLQ